MAPAAGYPGMWPCRITRMLPDDKICLLYKDGTVNVRSRTDIVHYLANAADLEKKTFDELSELRQAAWESLQKHRAKKDGVGWEDALNEYAVCTEESSRRSKVEKMKKTALRPHPRVLTAEEPPTYALRDRKFKLILSLISP